MVERFESVESREIDLIELRQTGRIILLRGKSRLRVHKAAHTSYMYSCQNETGCTTIFQTYYMSASSSMNATVLKVYHIDATTPTQNAIYGCHNINSWREKCQEKVMPVLQCLMLTMFEADDSRVYSYTIISHRELYFFPQLTNAMISE